MPSMWSEPWAQRLHLLLRRANFVPIYASTRPPTPFTSQRTDRSTTDQRPGWQDLTEKIDIYSMGNIFWAMLGRGAPFIRDDYYKKKVLRGERPYVDPSWHSEFVQVGRLAVVLLAVVVA